MDPGKLGPGPGQYGTIVWVPYLLRSWKAPPNGLRVLDLGCGDSTFVVENLQGKLATCFACDLYEDTLDAQWRLLENLKMLDHVVRLVVDSGERLPFRSCTFDLVVTMFHPPLVQPGPARAHLFGEVHRVLVPNGTMLVVPWNAEYAAFTTLSIEVIETYPPDSPFWDSDRIGLLKKL